MTRLQMTRLHKHAKQYRAVETGVESSPYRIFTRSGWKTVVSELQEPPFAVTFRGNARVAAKMTVVGPAFE